MALSDYGSPTDPLDSPSLSSWAASVESAVNGKAASGHDHSGTYDPAGTGTLAVNSHEALLDPHTQYVEGTGLTLWTGTQTAYDGIGVKDSSTVYVIT